MGSVISGGRGPTVPSPLQNKEAGEVKVNTGFTKVVTGLNKVKEEIKALREVIFFFI